MGAILKDDWKLYFNTNIGRRELFNIVEDPFEKNNLNDQYPDIADELKELWKQWKQELPE